MKIDRLKSTHGIGTLHVDVDQPEGDAQASVYLSISTWNVEKQELNWSPAIGVPFADVGGLIEELQAWRSRVRAHTIQEKCGCTIDGYDEVTPPCELEIGHAGAHQFTERTGVTTWPAGSGADRCPEKSPVTGKRCMWKHPHSVLDHKADEHGDMWPRVAEKKARRLATITDMDAHYPNLNERDHVSMRWRSEHVRKHAGEGGWGEWRPQNGMSGLVVSEDMRHPTSQAKLYLIDFGENHYVVFAERGVTISEETPEVAGEVKEIVGWIWRSNGLYFGTNGWKGTRRDAGIFPTIDAARATRKLGDRSVTLKRVVRKRPSPHKLSPYNPPARV